MADTPTPESRPRFSAPDAQPGSHGLTTDPNGSILRSDVDQGPRTARPAAGHARPADPAHPHLRPRTWTGDRARDPADVQRRAARRARRALSRAAAAREA